MKMRAQFVRKALCAAALSLACVAPLAAQSQTTLRREGAAWIQERTGVLPASATVRVQATRGAVTVISGGHGLRYTVRSRVLAPSMQAARALFSQLQIGASRIGAMAQLKLTDPRRSNVQTEVILELPHEMQVARIDTGSGAIHIENVAARLQLTTGGGDIFVRECERSVAASTGGGELRILRSAGDVTAHNGGGAIVLGDVDGHVELSGLGGAVIANRIGSGYVTSGGGDIIINRSGGDLIIKTGGGSVRLGEMLAKTFVDSDGGNIWLGSARGGVTVSTTSGNIELWKLGQSAHAESGSGQITAEFMGGRAFTDSYLRTGSGSLRVFLAGSTPATVEAMSQSAAGQGVVSNFRELQISTDGASFANRSVHAQGLLNGGGPKLKLSAFSGQINIYRE